MSKEHDKMHRALSELEDSAHDCLDGEHYLRVQTALDIVSGQIGCPMGQGCDDGEAIPCNPCIEHRPGGHEMMLERTTGDDMRWHTYDGHCSKCPSSEAV